MMAIVFCRRMNREESAFDGQEAMMKLEIRWRDVTPTAALFEHVKEGVAANARPHPWTLARLRVSLIGDQDWARCRMEVGLRTGATRVIEVISSDMMLAVDVASERLGDLLDSVSRKPSVRRAA
jgi:hypothetical protein